MPINPAPFSRFFVAGISTLAFTHAALASSETDYSKAFQLVRLRIPLKIDDAGKIEAETEKWKLDKDPEGTELFTAKTGPETRVAAMKNEDHQLDSLTTYSLGGAAKAETSYTVFFKKGKLAAFTNCEDANEKSSVGRSCVTATPKLCQNLKKSEGIDPETLKEVDLYEMRSLAAILTLRGADHQLENVVRSGNRLGLKSALQTTKGLIYALAKKLAVKEASKKGAEDETKDATQKMLDKALPRLKEACQVTQI